MFRNLKENAQNWENIKLYYMTQIALIYTQDEIDAVSVLQSERH